MSLPEHRVHPYKPTVEELSGTQQYLTSLFARGAELDLMRSTDLAVAIREDREAMLAGNPVYPGPVSHLDATLRYVDERVFRSTQAVLEPKELLDMVSSDLVKITRGTMDRRSFLTLMGGVGVAAATSALAIFVTSQPRPARIAEQPKSDNRAAELDRWVRRHVLQGQDHVAQVASTFHTFAPFILDPSYEGRHLSWLQPSLSPSELEPISTRDGFVILKNSSGRLKVDLESGYFPAVKEDFKPKIYLLDQTGEQLVRIEYTVNSPRQENPGRKFLEMIYFANRAGEPITEKAAAAELTTRGEWTREEITALAEAIHPKGGRQDRNVSYTKATDTKLPYDWITVGSKSGYQVLDPNKPQPLKGYFGDTTLSTFVRTRGSVTIRVEFTFTR